MLFPVSGKVTSGTGDCLTGAEATAKESGNVRVGKVAYKRVIGAKGDTTAEAGVRSYGGMLTG